MNFGNRDMRKDENSISAGRVSRVANSQNPSRFRILAWPSESHAYLGFFGCAFTIASRSPKGDRISGDPSAYNRGAFLDNPELVLCRAFIFLCEEKSRKRNKETAQGENCGKNSTHILQSRCIYTRYKDLEIP